MGAHIMALKVNTVHTGLQIKITEISDLDLATCIAVSLGYTLGDGVLEGSKDFIDNQGDYQGYYNPSLGIGAIWIDDNSEAYVKFNSLGGECWISNISKN
jgi:hypothetical protein